MKQRIKNKDDINLDSLIENIKSMIKEVEDGEYHYDNDWDHWIYESAIETVCKEGFWERFNSKT